MPIFKPVLGALALAVGTLAALPSAAAPKPADLVIRDVAVVDVAQGKIRRGQAVAIVGERIAAVVRDGEVARRWRGSRVVAGGGRYLIPGLWDMHVHFGGGPALVAENQALLPLYVAHGITTIRDCSGDLPQEVLAWRAAIADGRLFGPRLLTSGAKIEGVAPVWKGTLEVGTRADVDAALARLQRDRVDFVKITDSTLKPELFLYAVAAAKRLGLRTSGHIPMALTVRQAVAAGLSSIEHLDYAYKAGVRDEAAIAADFAAGRIDRAEANRRIDAGFDRATALASYRAFAKAGVFVTPTLNGSRILAYLDRDSHARDPYLAYIGPGLRATYDWRIQRAAQADAAAVAARHDHYERMAAILPLIRDGGATIIAGTDAGFLNAFNYPGIGLHDEMALFVARGLRPVDALRAATQAGPAWFGQQARYGAVAAGKAADLVLLDADPLRDIAATRAIRMVVMRGAAYDRGALDAMLADTKAKVAAWDARR